ncbi:MAG: hypothetical protein AAF364_19865 [Pseudomonadota bacterium]
MIRSIKQLQMSIILIIIGSVFNLLFVQNIHAEITIENIRKKVEQCQQWGQTKNGKAQNAAIHCLRYCSAYVSSPESLTSEGAEYCNKEYLNAKFLATGVKESETPADNDKAATKSAVKHRVRDTTNSTTTDKPRSSMPDVEGVFVALLKGRMRVRVDDYKDWSHICKDMVRVEHYSEIARKIKRKDRVRITGISYDPESVGRKGNKFHCEAERVIILGPS